MLAKSKSVSKATLCEPLASKARAIVFSYIEQASGAENLSGQQLAIWVVVGESRQSGRAEHLGT